jgi:pyruvate dehydrogenase E2 component (dihydrolipoamide acetyltransferase)
MPVEVILPKVDMDMETGKISTWHVKDGDTVKKGQPLFEIETDKAAMEIEAPADGVVASLAPVATDIPVGKAVAYILAPGEKAPATSSAPRSSLGAPSPPCGEGNAVASPSATITGAGTPIPSPQSGEGPRSGGEVSSRPRATPLARRLARQHALKLESLSGSGPRGRITAQDVKAPPIQAATPLAAAPSAEGTRLIPLDGMRRTIAQRLTQSKQTVPHFYLSITCVLDEMLAIRERLNAQAPRDKDKNPLWKLSVNDFIIKALATALQHVPLANVTWSDQGIIQHTASDVGVAVSVEGGLFTPVVRNANTKTLSQISIEVKDLAARARTKKLQPHEYQGGTSSVSNLGMFGIEEFSAIINPPQATILAVGAGIEQFVPVNGQPVVKTLMKATLSCDHRAVDGALGAQLLASFKQLIEEPALMLA